MDVIEIIQGLKKRVNISADTEATMTRARETWKGMTNVQKQEVLALTGVGQTVAHNTYKTGHLAAPIAIAMAKVAAINPAYLAGLTDKKGRFTPKTVYAFLSELGYEFADEAPAEHDDSDITPEAPAAGDAVPPADEPTAFDGDADEAPAPAEDETPAPAEDALPDPALSEEELYTLLRALLIKAQVSDEAKRTLADLRALLLH